MQKELSETTKRLLHYLSNVPDGQVITFFQLEVHCGWNKKAERHLLNSALKILANQGINFKAVRNVGYKRLEINIGVDHVRVWHNGQASRSTKRMQQKILGVHPGHLSRDGRRSHSEAMAEVQFRLEMENKLMIQQKQQEARDAAQRVQQELKDRAKALYGY